MLLTVFFLSNHGIRELVNVSKDFMQHFEGNLQEHGDGSTQINSHSFYPALGVGIFLTWMAELDIRIFPYFIVCITVANLMTHQLIPILVHLTRRLTGACFAKRAHSVNIHLNRSIGYETPALEFRHQSAITAGLLLRQTLPAQIDRW